MIKYKESGFDWLGEIPEHWELSTIGQEYNLRNEKVSDVDYQPLSVTKLPEGVVLQMENVAKSDAHDNRKLVLKNDFVINSRSDRKMSCGVSNYDGSVSLINIVLEHRKNIIPRFTHYLLKNYGFAEEFYRWGHGIVADLWTTSWDEMKKIAIPKPSIEEQKKIADLLDKKCLQIDELISIQEQEIEKLKEYKTAVITKAVTKGLEDSVSMKDTGIAWIGEIPEHWNCDRLKFFYRNRNEKFDGSDVPYFALENVESWSGVYIDSDSEYDKIQSNMVYAGDVVFGKLRPYLAKSLLVKEKQCCSSEFAIFYDKKEASAEYLHYLMLSHWFVNIVDSSTYGTKMPRANIEFIKNMVIPYPSYDEQKSICDWIKVRLTQINDLITLKNKKIEELKTYKKSMIYEYVTGKRSV